MLSDLTPAVARALDNAQRYAQDDGATEIQPQHLLHALLERDIVPVIPLPGNVALMPSGLMIGILHAA